MIKNFKELVLTSLKLTSIPEDRSTYFKEVVLNKCYGGFGLSKEAQNYIERYGNNESRYKRDSQVLIQCIKDLGEKADDDYSSLSIKYIPSCYDYEITEYDGYEDIKLLPQKEVIRDLSGNADALIEYLDAAGLISHYRE